MRTSAVGVPPWLDALRACRGETERSGQDGQETEHDRQRERGREGGREEGRRQVGGCGNSSTLDSPANVLPLLTRRQIYWVTVWERNKARIVLNGGLDLEGIY